MNFKKYKMKNLNISITVIGKCVNLQANQLKFKALEDGIFLR